MHGREQYSEDIEALRKHLGIEKWLVFGGSWGSLLSILYGQQHPERCLGFVLSAIFLGRHQDIRLFGGPDDAPGAYQEFVAHIPAGERNNLLAATYKQVMDPDPAVHVKMACAALRYHMLRTSKPVPSEAEIEERLKDKRQIVSFIRAVMYYAMNNLFIDENQAIMNMDRIAHLPAYIIHGQEDINCLPEQAVTLHENWKNSQLHILPYTGHVNNDAMVSALVGATNEFAAKNA